MKSTVRTAATVGMVAAAVVVVGAGSAGARSVSRTLQYSCALGDLHVSIEGVVHARIPDGAEAGRATETSTISVGTTIDGTQVSMLRLLGVKSVEATLDTSIRTTGAGGTRGIPVRLTTPELPVPSSGSMRVTASGKVPGQTFGTPGRVHLHAGDFTLHATAVKKDGEKIDNVNASCALETTDDTLASIQVKAPARGTPNPAPSAPAHQQPGGTGKDGDDLTDPASSPSARHQPAGTGRDRDELADSGQSTTWLLPLSAGTTTAGAAAVASVWLRRRHPGQGT